MRARILGVQKLDFTVKNERVFGSNLFVAFADFNVKGERCERYFLKPEIKLPESCKIGDEINILFDRHGKIEYIEPVEKK